MNAHSGQQVRYFQVDTFSTVPFSGAPAGVIADASGLSEDQMKVIARQMNLVEAVFCDPIGSDDYEAALTVVPDLLPHSLSGNAFLAAAHILRSEGVIGDAVHAGDLLRFKTPGGIVNLRRSGDPARSTYFVDHGAPHSERASQYKVDLIRLLNVTTSDYDPKFTIQKSSVLLVPIRRLHSLLTFVPSLPLVSTFLQSRRLSGICVYSTETIGRDSAFHVRFFSNRNGALEEPATGFVHAEVAAYLHEKGFVPTSSGVGRLLSEQGDALGRPSRMEIEVSVDTDGKLVRVLVGGSAVTVARGEIRIPT